jgi:hypothetical protein
VGIHLRSEDLARVFIIISACIHYCTTDSGGSINTKRLNAAMDTDYLENIMFGNMDI